MSSQRAPANTSCEDAAPITLLALGRQFELGMLYDARTGDSYAGVSPWPLAQILNNQQVVEQRDTKFHFSSSLTDIRSQAGLDAEGELSVDFGIFNLAGSAKYLDHKKKSKYEANVFVSCYVENQVRRIPQEDLARIPYEQRLENEKYTHFVAEVVEGGAAAITFSQQCANSDEQKRVEGALAGGLKKSISVSGNVKVGSDEQEKIYKSVEIKAYGDVKTAVGSIDQAVNVGKELPQTLTECKNTLRVTLLPLSTIDTTAQRKIRSLDTITLKEMSTTLSSLEQAALDIQQILQLDILKMFPILKRQYQRFYKAVDSRAIVFRDTVRSLLPQVKDGNTDQAEVMRDLEKAICVAKRQAEVAQAFIEAKQQECRVLDVTTANLFKQGFDDYRDSVDNLASVVSENSKPRLLLSFAGIKATHRFENQLSRASHASGESISSSETSPEGDHSASDIDDEDGDWFEDNATLEYLGRSSEVLRKLRHNNRLAEFEALYGVTTAGRAFRADGRKMKKTRIGDIVLEANGRRQIVTPVMLGPPNLSCTVNKQTVKVAWDPTDSEVLPATGFRISYQPTRNADLDEFDQAVAANEPVEYLVQPDGDSRQAALADLRSFTDYRIAIQKKTALGFSSFSDYAIVRTEKKPSVASDLITFFLNEKSHLQGPKVTPDNPRHEISQSGNNATDKKRNPWEQSGGRKGWEMQGDSLFLGFKTSAIHGTRGEIHVIVVDVVPEFKQDIPLGAEKDAKVIMLVGKTGVGKTTEINALVSYLLEGALGDSHRLMLVDDRGVNEVDSVTRYITVYRIRSLSDRCRKLGDGSIYIVDTPGYGDTDGHARDTFITRAMSQLFKTITHVNAVIFTSVSNETRAGPSLVGVATHIFQLFSKDVRGCLRTVLTYSDAGKAPAIDVLESLGWPVKQNGYVEVNNAAFKITGRVTENLKRWWNMSLSGQCELVKMISLMPPVSTAKSAQVTDKRMTLQQKCELAEKKVYDTANKSQILLANMDALANAVGASPKDKIAVTKTETFQEDIPNGKYTTLCTTCNHTCHELCQVADDARKAWCAAMDWSGKCKICPGKCSWRSHKNARFIIRAREKTEMVIPEELIKEWNQNTNTLEGALLDALNKFLDIQDELLSEIKALHSLTCELRNIALKHDPKALLKYIEELIRAARAQGAHPEQLQALHSAKNVLVISDVLAKTNIIPQDTKALMDVVSMVREELQKRNEMPHQERVRAEEQPSSLYNDVLERLPSSIRNIPGFPEPLKAKALDFASNFVKTGNFKTDAKFKDNLKAIIKLIGFLLKHGAIHSVGCSD